MRYCAGSFGQSKEPPGNVRPWLVTGWGLGYGLILCAVFAWGWKYFGDIYFSEYSRLRIVPMSLVTLATGVLGFKQLTGFCLTLDRLANSSRSTESASPSLGLAGQTALGLVLLLKFAALLAMPYPTPWLPGDWRHYFIFLYPKVMYYRVFILMGLWSMAGLLIAGATGPTDPQIPEQDRTFRRSLTIRSLVGNLIFTFLVTSVYFSQWQNRAMGLLVSFVIFLLVYLVSMLLSWRLKGHDRNSMFACAETAELLLLFGYLAIARYI